MAILRIGDMPAYAAFADGCGCSLTILKRAISSVGYDELDILHWLNIKQWVSDEAYEGLRKRVSATPLFAASLPKVKTDGSTKKPGHANGGSNVLWKDRVLEIDMEAANSSQAFLNYLRRKMPSNMALQRAYVDSQADGANELIRARRIVVALVEANEHLMTRSYFSQSKRRA